MMRFFKDSKKILHLTLPLLSSRLMNVIVFFAGFVMVAKLGPEEFAASSLANSMFITLVLIGVGILYAIGIKMSHAFGAEDNEKIREYLHSGLLLGVLLGIAEIVFILIFSLLLPHLGQRPELIPYAKTFMHAICLPLIPAMLSIVLNQLVTALLKPRIVFINSVINVPITIGALYLFIFGGLGIPSLGIWGFGVALLIGDIALVIVPVVYVLKTEYFKQFNLTNFTHIEKTLFPRMMEILRLGIPMGVQFGTEVAAFSVCTFLIGFFGIAALNSFQIANQIIVVALMVPMTMSEATAILVGQSVGKNDPVAMRSYGFSSVKLGVLIIIFISALFYLIPKVFIHIYIDINDPALASTVRLSVLFLYVAAISQIFDAVRNIITGSLRGLHDSQYPMYVGIFVMWLIWIPLGLLMAFPLKFGPIGFQIAGIFALLVGAIILLIRFHRKTKEGHIPEIMHHH